MLGQNPSAHFGFHGRGRRHRCAVGAHDLAAKGLLLIAALDHIHLAVQTEVAAGHGKRGAPLSGTGFGSHTLQALLLGIVGLGDGGIELVAAAGVVAFEFVVDFRRSPELFLQAVRPDQGSGAVHFIEITDFRGNFEIRRFVV